MMWWSPEVTAIGWGGTMLGALVMLLVWGALLALVVLAARVLVGLRPGVDEAFAILQRRFAAGEISQSEFEETRRALVG